MVPLPGVRDMGTIIRELQSIRVSEQNPSYLLRTVIGGQIQQCDPFLRLDHIGPEVFEPGEAFGAPDHPHRGFETVTYIIDGGIEHRDSLGTQGCLGPGDLQWLTCGSGIVHSEMPTQQLTERGGRAEGFQLWVNLPIRDKLVAARYQERSSETIPVYTSADGDVSVKVLAGTCQGVSSTIENKTQLMFLDIHIHNGARFSLDIPPDYRTVAYVWRGRGMMCDRQARMGDAATLKPNFNGKLHITAPIDSDLHVLVCGGVPTREPIILLGPFVMHSLEAIRQAVSDYQSGLMGSIEGKEQRIADNELAQKKYQDRKMRQQQQQQEQQQQEQQQQQCEAEDESINFNVVD